MFEERERKRDTVLYIVRSKREGGFYTAEDAREMNERERERERTLLRNALLKSKISIACKSARLQERAHKKYAYKNFRFAVDAALTLASEQRE